MVKAAKHDARGEKGSKDYPSTVGNEFREKASELNRGEER